MNSRSNVASHTARINVDAMVSLGLLERERDRYSNSAAAARYLSGTPGSDLRPVLRHSDRLSFPLWMNFEDTVRAGEGQRQFSRFNKEEQEIFSAGFRPPLPLHSRRIMISVGLPKRRHCRMVKPAVQG